MYLSNNYGNVKYVMPYDMPWDIPIRNVHLLTTGTAKGMNGTKTYKKKLNIAQTCFHRKLTGIKDGSLGQH